jgi:hypothetical protein
MNELRTQSRLASFIEACANTIIGYCIALFVTVVALKWLGVQITGPQLFWYTWIMTAVSVVRSYALRRLWNAEWWKRFKRKHPNKPHERWHDAPSE